ncbi:PASTA domain-containing protein [Salisaeta longa]|uniref:PASTA domain-containing protein n=1 Tax=Salisaeta longa TaxID=503170 RepID=UPI0003B3AE00|nr:PASTA domain-containing protein [Salisaeta longa]
MNWTSDAQRWLRSLATNKYFWQGLGGLLAIALLVYVVIDFYVMPQYTRHGVSTTVPSVVDQPFETAARTIRAHNLEVEQQIGKFNPNVPQNYVLDQTPPANAGVKPGRRVYLTINRGSIASVRLPDLSGASIREARNRLQALGLRVDTVRADSIPSPYRNTITRQRPAPGDSIKQGRAVTLWYSTGMGEEQKVVPNVVGLRVERAQQRLLRNMLRSVVLRTGTLDEKETGAPADSTGPLYVRDQSRRPGTRVLAGTEVRLFVTPDPSSIPDSLRRRTATPPAPRTPQTPLPRQP